MVRKLLQWLGVAFVLALCASAAAALLVCKDRVRIVVQADETAAGPDPVALLRDDVQVLQRELGELRSSLGGNFERLGTALEERAEARQEADLRSLSNAHTSLQKGQDRHGEELARLFAKVDAMAAARALPAGDPSPAPVPAIPTEELTPTEPLPVVAPEPKAASEPQPPVPKKAAFLSFSVAQAKFQFDQPQDYVLVPELCRVGFDAKSTLHDFTGVTSKVAGQFTADFDDPSGGWSGEVACESKTLATGVDGRDTAMQEHLDTAHHPQIRFVIGAFEPANVDVARQTADGVLTGKMTIRGETRAVRMPVKISVDPSKRVVVEGQMPLALSDYHVVVPSQLGGTITMQDEVSVWIALRARVQTGARK